MRESRRRNVISECSPPNQHGAAAATSAARATTHKPATKHQQKRTLPIASVAVAVPNSSYHALDSIVSSDSRDDGCGSSVTTELTLSDKEEEEENHVARLRKRSSMMSTPSDSVGVPPPPPKTPPPSSLRACNKHHNNPTISHSSGSGTSSSASSSHYESFDAKTTHACQIKASPTPLSSQQNKRALLSLLQEMRTLEHRIQSQAAEHALERSVLVDTLSRQSAHTKQLEEKVTKLQTQNGMLKHQQETILTKLDRFATGCWKFPSSSVKKMSEALHIQVQEWRRVYHVRAKNDTASPSSSSSTEESEDAESSMENEAMVRTTMEKLQFMHLQTRELREENQRLKTQLKRNNGSSDSGRSKKRGNDTMLTGSGDGGVGAGGEGDDCKSALSGMEQHSDEVSHLSGVTQMSNATKLMDTMSGFLNEHGDRPQPPVRRTEREQQQQAQRRQDSGSVSSADLVPAITSSSSSPRPTPALVKETPTLQRTAGKSPRSTIHKSPQSILKKQTICKYTDRQGVPTNSSVSSRLHNSEHRVRLQLHQDTGQRVRPPGKQPLLRQQRQQQQQVNQQPHTNQHGNQRQQPHHQRKYQAQQRAAAVGRLKPPKSPNKRMDRNRVNAPVDDFGFDATPRFDNSAIAFGTFPNANNDDFVTTEDMDYHQWASWGDEESEV